MTEKKRPPQQIGIQSNAGGDITVWFCAFGSRQFPAHRAKQATREASGCRL